MSSQARYNVLLGAVTLIQEINGGKHWSKNNRVMATAPVILYGEGGGVFSGTVNAVVIYGKQNGQV